MEPLALRRKRKRNTVDLSAPWSNPTPSIFLTVTADQHARVQHRGVGLVQRLAAQERGAARGGEAADRAGTFAKAG